MLQALLSSVRNIVRGEYYRSPEQYWRARHERYATSLRGVGCVSLDEAKNAEDYLAKWQHIAAALARTGPTKGRSLLDAGCGVGRFTAEFVQLGFHVSAVDFAANAVETARRRLGERSRQIAWHVSPLDRFAPGRTYELVVCIDVLFHIVDDRLFEKAVANLASLTTAGGYLVIQDHLIPEAEVAAEQPTGSSHVRWRSLERYLRVLGDEWLLKDHVHYELPREKGTKDLMVFARKGGPNGRT